MRQLFKFKKKIITNTEELSHFSINKRWQAGRDLNQQKGRQE